LIIYNFSAGRFEYFNSEIDLDIQICVNCRYDTVLLFFENGDNRIWFEICNSSFTFNKLTLEYVEIYNRD
jgi:hypothetical protein